MYSKRRLKEFYLDQYQEVVYNNQWKTKMSDSDIENISNLFKVPKNKIEKDPYWYNIVTAVAIFKQSKLVSFEISRKISD